jgi:hypothetical protein
MEASCKAAAAALTSLRWSPSVTVARAAAPTVRLSRPGFKFCALADSTVLGHGRCSVRDLTKTVTLAAAGKQRQATLSSGSESLAATPRPRQHYVRRIMMRLDEVDVAIQVTLSFSSILVAVTVGACGHGGSPVTARRRRAPAPGPARASPMAALQ